MQALPYATQLLAHLGADVVKVEPPGRGDAGRLAQPALTDKDGRQVGATYLRNNLGKRSIAIDLKHPEGRALFERLVPHFDVIAENMRPGAMDALGLGARRDRQAGAARDPALDLRLRRARLESRTASGPRTRRSPRRWPVSTSRTAAATRRRPRWSRARSATSRPRSSP